MDKEPSKKDSTPISAKLVIYNAITQKYGTAEQHFYDGLILGFLPTLFGFFFWICLKL